MEHYFWLRQEPKKGKCSFVRLMISALELTIFIFLSEVILRIVSGQSLVSLRSLCTYLVRQTEPKILRLVSTHVLTGVHHELALDGPHAVLLVLGEQLVAGDHQGVHVADAASRGEDAVASLVSNDLPHLLEDLVLHQNEDGGDLVGEHVGVSGGSEPLPRQGGHIQAT